MKVPSFDLVYQCALTGILTLGLLLSTTVLEVEGKRKRKISPPPLKIIDVSTSPVPYAPGKKPLTMTIEVELPKNLNKTDLLEVSSFISIPSKRSIRFLHSRQPVSNSTNHRGRPRLSTTLFWDGTDQTHQLVVAGTYHYQVRAKLLANDSDGLRTRMVSIRARGTLEVSAPEKQETPDVTDQSHVTQHPFPSDVTTPESSIVEKENLHKTQENSLSEKTSPLNDPESALN